MIVAKQNRNKAGNGIITTSTNEKGGKLPEVS
jgi:hypothetical protein